MEGFGRCKRSLQEVTSGATGKRRRHTTPLQAAGAALGQANVQEMSSRTGIPAHLRKMCQELSARHKGQTTWRWEAPYLLELHQELMQGLRSTLAGLDAPTEECTLSVCLEELRAAIFAQRQIVNGMTKEQEAATCAVYQHWAERNMRHPLETVVQLHEDMLATVKLRPEQTRVLVSVAREFEATTKEVAAERKHVYASLIMALRSGTGPLMQQITTGCLHSHTLVERLTVLQEMDLRAHFRLRQRFVFNQVLDAHQAARMQVLDHPSVIPDMPLLSRLLLRSVEPTTAPASKPSSASVSFDEPSPPCLAPAHLCMGGLLPRQGEGAADEGMDSSDSAGGVQASKAGPLAQGSVAPQDGPPKQSWMPPYQHNISWLAPLRSAPTAESGNQQSDVSTSTGGEGEMAGVTRSDVGPGCFTSIDESLPRPAVSW